MRAGGKVARTGGMVQSGNAVGAWTDGRPDLRSPWAWCGPRACGRARLSALPHERSRSLRVHMGQTPSASAEAGPRGSLGGRERGRRKPGEADDGRVHSARESGARPRDPCPPWRGSLCARERSAAAAAPRAGENRLARGSPPDPGAVLRLGTDPARRRGHRDRDGPTRRGVQRRNRRRVPPRGSCLAHGRIAPRARSGCVSAQFLVSAWL